MGKHDSRFSIINRKCSQILQLYLDPYFKESSVKSVIKAIDFSLVVDISATELCTFCRPGKFSACQTEGKSSDLLGKP